MSNNGTTNDTSDMSAVIDAELAGEFGNELARAERARAALLAERGLGGDRLPRKIEGGFQGLSDDLHSRAVEWRNVFRLLEQQRPLLEAAEGDRDRLLSDLGRIVPQVQESARLLAGNVDTAKKGDLSADLAQRFTAAQSAIGELESVTELLSANLQFLRSTWEQYARTALRAHKLREELRTL